MGTMALCGRGLEVGYQGASVIQGVDLELRPDEMVCLLGPNGAGKSTLVRALAGLMALRHGQVHLEDTPLSELSPAARARRIGFLPQEVRPSFSFRVEEAVALGARCAGHGNWFDPAAGVETEQAVERALAAVDASGLRRRRLEELSGGERRRVLLASVLAQEPRYLLLDEPSAMLDLEHQVALFELLAKLAASGIGVLVVTHDLNLAGRWADQIVLLKEGRILSRGRPGEVLVREQLEPVFGTRFHLLPTPDGPPAVVPQ